MEKQKRLFCYIAPSKPFKFKISIGRRIESGRESEEESEEESEKVINTELTLKYNECVICITNPPNVLFCNYGHIPICKECGKMKSLNTCLVCKTKNTIKRTIEC